ncbi:hypothetical protein GCM10020255_105730 [Rhodococcus baikonurensis]
MEAITDPEMLAQWTPYTADRNLSRTGDAVITMLTEDGAPEMSLPVTVHVVETARRLEHEWGPDELVWDLTSVEGGTRVVLTQRSRAEGMASALAAGGICASTYSMPFWQASPSVRSWVNGRASTVGTRSTRAMRDAWVSTNLRSGSCSEFSSGGLSTAGYRAESFLVEARTISSTGSLTDSTFLPAISASRCSSPVAPIL